MTRWLENLALRSVPRDWRESVERDLRDEWPPGAGSFWIAFHAARVGARLRLTRSADLTRRSRHKWRSPMQDFHRDIRFALRAGFRQPGYALAVIATLAIGIGANTAIFSVVTGIMLQKLQGVAEPDRMVTVK